MIGFSPDKSLAEAESFKENLRKYCCITSYPLSDVIIDLAFYKQKKSFSKIWSDQHRRSGPMLSISQNVHMFVCLFVCVSVCVSVHF